MMSVTEATLHPSAPSEDLKAPTLHQGEVIKLDRGFPLVRLEDGFLLRCEHATNLVKHGNARAVIGDAVTVAVPEGHTMGVLEAIGPRKTTFTRKDPTERTLPQILAANFDHVMIVQPIDAVNYRRLERELVMAFETGAHVSVILTKADLLADPDEEQKKVVERVSKLAGRDVSVLTTARTDPTSIEALRRSIPHGSTAILIGRSGVGKSTIVNLLLGHAARKTSSVRASDGKGRHTTVSREILTLPNGGRIVDMPGVRGLGLWDAQTGLENAFSDIEQLAKHCRFRDCKHDQEPGCAVWAAIEEGYLGEERLASYRALRDELDATHERRRRSSWKDR